MDGKPVLTNDELIAKVKTAHQRVRGGLRTTVEAAREAGEALILLRAGRPKRGQPWGEWVQEAIGISYETANDYINVAKRWDAISAHPDFPNITLARALKKEKKPDGVAKKRPVRVRAEAVKQAVAACHLKASMEKVRQFLLALGIEVVEEKNVVST